MKTLKWLRLSAVTLFVANSTLGDPVAHYTFDDSGDRFKDVSGNGYHGVLNGSGTTFASSGVAGLGDAMQSTTSSRVLVDTIPVSLNSFAISFWATSGTDWDNWISFGGTDNFFLQNAPYATPAAFLDNPGGVSGYTSWDLATSLAGGLNHIVVTADSTAGTASIYYNGVLADTAAWSVSSGESFGYLTIGGARNTTARNINATIDDVQVYGAALSGGDVSYLYTNPGSVIPEPATMSLILLFSLTGVFIRRILEI